MGRKSHGAIGSGDGDIFSVNGGGQIGRIYCVFGKKGGFGGIEFDGRLERPETGNEILRVLSLLEKLIIFLSGGVIGVS